MSPECDSRTENQDAKCCRVQDIYHPCIILTLGEPIILVHTMVQVSTIALESKQHSSALFHPRAVLRPQGDQRPSTLVLVVNYASMHARWSFDHT